VKVRDEVMSSSNADESKAANKSPAKQAPAESAGAPQRLAVTADDRRAELSAKCPMPDPYPEYCVTLAGLGNDHVMTGTHDGTIEMSDPELTVTLRHDCTEPGVPNVIITIARKP
jgi:hypothetical protein